MKIKATGLSEYTAFKSEGTVERISRHILINFIQSKEAAILIILNSHLWTQWNEKVMELSLYS